MRARIGIAAIIWLALVISAAVTLSVQLRSGVVFSSSILALLPSSEAAPIIEVANDHLTDQYANKIIIVLKADSSRKETVTQVTERVYLQLIASNKFRTVTTQPIDSNVKTLVKPYEEYHRALISDNTRSIAASEGAEVLVKRSINDLYSPFAPPRYMDYHKDPLNLFGDWLSGLPGGNGPGKNIKVDAVGYYIESPNDYYRIIFAEIEGDPFDINVQQDVLNLVNAARSAAFDAGITLVSTGLVFHAAHGADQARSEMSTIGVGSMLGIVGLLLFVFVSLRVLLVALLPLMVGCLVAVVTCLLILDELHLITLAFGASLVGISIDYVFHFLCAPVSDKSGKFKTYLWPALLLGLASSVVAYTSLLAMPFPGLQQMGLFSVVGLGAAWLTQVLWGGFLLPDTSQISQLRAAALVSFGRIFLGSSSGFVRKNSAIIVLVFGVISLVWLVSIFKSEDDVGYLNTSSTQMLDREQEVQKLLGFSSASVYFVVTGTDFEAILSTEETLKVELAALRAAGDIKSYDLVSDLIPSRRIQSENLQQWHNLHQPDSGIEALFRLVGLSQSVSLSQQNDGAKLLDFIEWRTWEIAKLNEHLFSAPDALQPYTLVMLHGVQETAKPKFIALAGQYSQVYWVDRYRQISDLLARYRVMIGYWLMAIYVVIGLLLALRLGIESVMVVATPAVATLGSLLILSLFGQPITLFHLLAGMLVLGIGLDMGIFLRASKAANHAVLAVTCGALTTLMAFGLLALSDTPVLKYFGQMSALGILISWLISMYLISYHKNKTNEMGYG